MIPPADAPPARRPSPLAPVTERVLGVDPGSRTTGWGLVERAGSRYVLVAAGAIRTPEAGTTAERLIAIHTGLQAVITLHAPASAAIEVIFMHRSSTSALILGQARGVALLALAQAGLPVHEYNASTIKLSVGGSGKADKAQVARMVKLLVGADVPGPADATDAVAIAITHHVHAGRRALEARMAVPRGAR